MNFGYQVLGFGGGGHTHDADLTLLYQFDKTKSLVAVDELGPTLVITRATDATYFDSNGVMQTASSGVARFTHLPISPFTSLGLLVEEKRINIAVDTGDVSDDATWAPTNMTKGSDSVTDPTSNANTNVRLTAAAGNATLLQTVTSASDNYIYGQYMKRVTGSGDIQLTLDGGTTWVTKTLTSEWTRFNVLDASETNPVFGVRIVISGDAIDFWGADVNKDATLLTSHIPNNADSGTVTRNFDDVDTTDVDWVNPLGGTFYVKSIVGAIQSDDGLLVYLQGTDGRVDIRRAAGTMAIRGLGVPSSGDLMIMDGLEAGIPGAINQVAMAWAEDDGALQINADGLITDSTFDLVDLAAGLNQLQIGGSDTFIVTNSPIAEIRYYNVRKDNQFLADLSNGLKPE